MKFLLYRYEEEEDVVIFQNHNVLKAKCSLN